MSLSLGAPAGGTSCSLWCPLTWLRVPKGWDVPGGVGTSTAVLLGAPRRGPPKGWAAVYVARISFGLGKTALDVWVAAVHVLLVNCAVCLVPPALLQQSPSSPTS